MEPPQNTNMTNHGKHSKQLLCSRQLFPHPVAWVDYIYMETTTILRVIIHDKHVDATSIPNHANWEWLSIFPMAFMEPSLSSSMASIYIYIYICIIYLYIYMDVYIYMYVIYTYVIYISLSIYVICPHFRIEGNAEAIAFGSHHTIHRRMCFQMCSHHLRCLRRRLVDFGHWNPVILILPWGNPNVRKNVEILQLPSGNLIWQWNIPSLKGIQNLWMGDFALAG